MILNSRSKSVRFYHEQPHRHPHCRWLFEYSVFHCADTTNGAMSACDTLITAYGDEFETFINGKVEEPRGAELASAKERGLYSWIQRLDFSFPFAYLSRSLTPLFLPILPQTPLAGLDLKHDRNRARVLLI